MNKTTIILGVIIALLIGGYFFMNGTASNSDATLQQIDQAAVDSTAGTKIPAILNEVQRLQIDKSIFSNLAYLSLVDHSVVIPPQNVSRENPFAPLPGMPTTVVAPKR